MVRPYCGYEFYVKKLGYQNVSPILNLIALVHHPYKSPSQYFKCLDHFFLSFPIRIPRIKYSYKLIQIAGVILKFRFIQTDIEPAKFINQFFIYVKI